MALLGSPAVAGDPVDPIQQTTQFTEVYEGGRGLITLQGPTGMFQNPTSGTMPQGAFTAQYCFFSPFVDTSVLGHGFLAAYGVTDWLEVAALTTYIDAGDNLAAAGPQVRARLMKNEGFLPQVSVGYYGSFGDAALEKNTVYIAGYNRIPLAEDGLLKSLGVHYGLRNSWIRNSSDDLRGYGGIELQLPLRVYVVGEMATKDDDFGGEIPFSYGLQWRSGGINISVAMVQPGDLTDGPGFWFGIGSQLSF